jgi:N-acetyl-gamma-glutamyl-phosphate reductase / acetylglutamate kinase
VTGHLQLHPTSSGSDFKAVTAETIRSIYSHFYKGEALVSVLGNDAKTGKPDTPDVARHGTLKHGVTVGGFTFDPSTGRLALVSTLDNLLKGAATQALQNINLAMGLGEYKGIPTNKA